MIDSISKKGEVLIFTLFDSILYQRYPLVLRPRGLYRNYFFKNVLDDIFIPHNENMDQANTDKIWIHGWNLVFSWQPCTYSAAAELGDQLWPIDLIHKSHNASDKYPTVHHFTKWCIVGYLQCMTLNIFKHCHLGYLNLKIYSLIKFYHSHVFQWYQENWKVSMAMWATRF